MVLSICLFSLAIGSTIACCLFAYNGGSGSASGDGLTGGVTMGIKAASYFWMLAALMAWWRVRISMGKTLLPDTNAGATIACPALCVTYLAAFEITLIGLRQKLTLPLF